MPFLKKPPTPRQTVEWKPIVIGGGGLLLHVEISQDGATILTNCDVGGLWRFDDATDTWDDIATQDRMPLIFQGSRHPGFAQNSNGFTAASIAPSDSDIIYAIWRPQNLANISSMLIKSVNRGESWSICEGFGPFTDADGNATYYNSNASNWKFFWRKIGIDPSNPDVIYVPWVGAGLKPRMSVDGGATFTPITGLPNNVASSIGAGFFAIDPSSAVSGGRHQRIVCYMYGDGFYESTDGGTNWTEFYNYTGAFSDGGAFGPDGAFFVGVNGVGILRYKDATVTNVKSATSGQNVKVAVHPTIAGKIATANPSGTQLSLSTDHGDNFTDYNTNTDVTITCPSVGWQEEQMQAHQMGTGNLRQIAWNPAIAHELWACHSQGIMRGTMNGSDDPEFVAHVLGTETLVGNWVHAAPGKSHINLCNWDEAGFIKTKTAGGLATPPSDKHGPASIAPWVLYNIWSFASDPQDEDFLTCAGNLRSNSATNAGNGYSTDGGLTWTDFAAFPAVPAGASADFRHVAVNDGVLLYHYCCNGDGGVNQNGHVYPYRSTDLGATWTALDAGDFTGHPGTPWSGFGAGSPLQYHVFVADRVNPDVFYGMNISSASGKRGLWRSTDRGLTWANIDDTLGNTITLMRAMWAVPENEGHLFLIPSGDNTFHLGMNIPTGSAAGKSVYRTTNAGTTPLSEWSSDIKNVDGFGFGKAREPGMYPTIYFSGHYKGDYGIYRVVNNDLSTIVQYWSDATKRWPLGYGTGNWIIQHLTGDPDTFGRVYGACGGRGFFYADLA
jgi:hypothetical protein